MRYWIFYVAALVLMAAAAWFAPIVFNDPGDVEIVVGEWVIETTVVALSLGFIGLFLGLWLLAWMLEAPRRLGNRLARRGLENGLLALAEGDWKKAEKTLLRAARHLDSPAGYLAAARSAQGSDAEQRRESYLLAADDGSRRSRLLIGLTRARVLMSEEQWLEAAQLLLQLRAQHARHDQVLRMLLHCYRMLGDWRGALTILPDLRKRKIVNDAQAADITALALEQAAEQGHSNVPALWQTLPKSVQHHAEVLGAYARAARRAKHPEWVLPILVKTMKREWSEDLVEAYGMVAAADAKKALAQCETWRKAHPEDPALEQLMGELCAVQGLWGKARDHYERSIALRPTPQAYRMLGDFLTERGENDQALICYRNALKLEQGTTPQPLPALDWRNKPVAAVAAQESPDLIATPKDYA